MKIMFASVEKTSIREMKQPKGNKRMRLCLLIPESLFVCMVYFVVKSTKGLASFRKYTTIKNNNNERKTDKLKCTEILWAYLKS